MKTKRINQPEDGTVEPLPEALRDMLLGGGTRGNGAANDLPGVPRQAKHKNGTDAPRTVSRGHLSNRQKQVLCQLAAAAYEVQAKHGLVDDGVKLDAWRRAEQLAAVGVGSLRECRQAHYLPLKGHFEALAGKGDAEAFAKMTAAADDPDRQTIRAILREELDRFADLDDGRGGRMGWHRAAAYARSIAKSRGYVGPDDLEKITDHWRIDKLWTLVFTLRNRIAAKRGVGDGWQRNKGQRRSGGE